MGALGGGAVYENGTACVRRAVFADRADEHADELTVAAAADDQEIGALGGFDEDRCGMPADHPAVYPQAGMLSPHPGDGGVECPLHIRFGIEVVRDRHGPAVTRRPLPCHHDLEAAPGHD